MSLSELPTFTQRAPFLSRCNLPTQATVFSSGVSSRLSCLIENFSPCNRPRATFVGPPACRSGAYNTCGSRTPKTLDMAGTRVTGPRLTRHITRAYLISQGRPLHVTGIERAPKIPATVKPIQAELPAESASSDSATTSSIRQFNTSRSLKRTGDTSTVSSNVHCSFLHSS